MRAICLFFTTPSLWRIFATVCLFATVTPISANAVLSTVADSSPRQHPSRRQGLPQECCKGVAAPPELRLHPLHARAGPCHDAAQLDGLSSQHVCRQALPTGSQLATLLSVALLKACAAQQNRSGAVLCCCSCWPGMQPQRVPRSPHSALRVTSEMRSALLELVEGCVSVTLCESLLKLLDQLRLPHGVPLEGPQRGCGSCCVLVVQGRLLDDASHLTDRQADTCRSEARFKVL